MKNSVNHVVPFCKYLDALRQFPFSVCQQPQHYFQRPGRDFTRRRSLWLERIVWLGVGLLKKHNLQTASFHPARKHIRALKRRRKHDYRPNRNVTGGLLKRFIVRFFLRPRAELAEALAEYRRLVLMNLEPERPDQNRERRRRLMRGTERHVHEKNYRRAQ